MSHHSTALAAASPAWQRGWPARSSHCRCPSGRAAACPSTRWPPHAGSVGTSTQYPCRSRPGSRPSGRS
eukprot:6204455-Pleurochrysis_carterae.AAC.1